MIVRHKSSKIYGTIVLCVTQIFRNLRYNFIINLGDSDDRVTQIFRNLRHNFIINLRDSDDRVTQIFRNLRHNFIINALSLTTLPGSLTKSFSFKKPHRNSYGL